MRRRNTLSIRTPEGREHEKSTDRAWVAIMKYFKGCTLHKTSDTHPADAIIKRAGKPVALVEIKSRRDFTEQFFWDVHRGTWLITAHKIDSNIPIAKSLGVPFIGAMHIVQDQVVLLKTIWEQDHLCTGVEKRHTETRARIESNDRITRLNAFVPMHNAIRLIY